MSHSDSVDLRLFFRNLWLALDALNPSERLRGVLKHVAEDAQRNESSRDRITNGHDRFTTALQGGIVLQCYGQFSPATRR